jgi:hypothetical protein
MIKQNLYRTFTSAAVITTMALVGYVAMEPGLVVAQSASDSVSVSLTVDSGITIDAPGDVTMDPTLGISSNSSTGSVSWTVVTNDPDGYTLGVAAAQANALHSSTDAFTDYTEATDGTPETWSVANAYEFGFSAFGGDVADSTWGAGSACSVFSGGEGAEGIIPSNLKYEGFNGTTSIQVASNDDPTGTDGTATSLCFAAEQETEAAPAGSYTAVITATATVQ